MTVRDVLPNHPVEIMVRTNYPESLLPYLSSERIEQGLLVIVLGMVISSFLLMAITILWMRLFQNTSTKRMAV